MKPSLIVHGGAWDIPEEAFEACKEGCGRALEAGGGVLSRGGPGPDAVEAAIVELEDAPVFDAGTGSHLNLDGRVECDAMVMDGASLRAGAVACVQRIRNPIRLARAVLERAPHMMLVGEGAERFAAEHGIAQCDPKELITEAELAAWLRCRNDKHAAKYHRGHEQGTVGAVAMDREGRLIAGTSTGGTCCKLPGRVGDSPLIGCGCYADAEAGGVSWTGWGEAIMKIVIAKAAAGLLRGCADAGDGRAGADEGADGGRARGEGDCGARGNRENQGDPGAARDRNDLIWPRRGWAIRGRTEAPRQDAHGVDSSGNEHGEELRREVRGLGQQSVHRQEGCRADDGSGLEEYRRRIGFRRAACGLQGKGKRDQARGERYRGRQGGVAATAHDQERQCAVVSLRRANVFAAEMGRQAQRAGRKRVCGGIFFPGLSRAERTKICV